MASLDARKCAATLCGAAADERAARRPTVATARSPATPLSANPRVRARRVDASPPLDARGIARGWWLVFLVSGDDGPWPRWPWWTACAGVVMG